MATVARPVGRRQGRVAGVGRLGAGTQVGARLRQRAREACTSAIGEARRRDADARATEDVAEMGAEAGWKPGRRVLIEAGERARRKRGRGEVALRMIKRIMKKKRARKSEVRM